MYIHELLIKVKLTMNAWLNEQVEINTIDGE